MNTLRATNPITRIVSLQRGSIRMPESWKLLETIPNRYPYDPATGEGATSDFYIYAKR